MDPIKIDPEQSLMLDLHFVWAILGGFIALLGGLITIIWKASGIHWNAREKIEDNAKAIRATETEVACLKHHMEEAMKDHQEFSIQLAEIPPLKARVLTIEVRVQSQDVTLAEIRGDLKWIIYGLQKQQVLPAEEHLLRDPPHSTQG
jgi:hypothetical protein